MHTNSSYEETYIQSLRLCTIQETMEGFDRERKAFFGLGNYEEYVKATIYWARLKLLFSDYESVHREVKSTPEQSWYKDIDAFTQARLKLIETKVYYALGEFQVAYEGAREALGIASMVVPEDKIPERDEDYFFCRAYLVKAKINWRRRDIYRAKLFMALSWIYYNKCRKVNGHYLPARLLCHYGQIYLKEDKANRAREYFLKSREFYERGGYQRHFYLPETLSLLGECSIKEKRYDEAEADVEEALKLLERHFKEVMNRNRAHLLHLLAKIRIGKAEQERSSITEKERLAQSATEPLKDELRIRDALFGGKERATTARIHNALSKAHRLKGEYEMAVTEAKKALTKNIPAFSGRIEAYAPDRLADIAGSPYHILVSLKRMAEVYWERYKSEKGPDRHSALESAWDHLRHCQTMINVIREKYYAHESKANVGAYARVIFELGMEILLERKARAAEQKKPLDSIHDDIFELFRNSKSFLLLQALHPYSISSISGRQDKTGEYSPESLRNLMAAINDCFSSGFEQQGLDEELIKEVIYASEKDIREDIKKEIQSESEPGARTKPHLEDIYKALRKETEPGDIISYFLGQNGLYAMVIQGSRRLQFEKLLSGAREIERLKQDARDLAALFDQFVPGEVCNDFSRFSWKAQDLTKDPNWRLVDYSQRLYRILFSKLQIKASRLYIIPDEHLFNIPFGFLTRPLPKNQHVTKFSDLPYLALQYRISYHISTSLLYENHEREGREENRETGPGNYILYNIAGKSLKNGVLTGENNSQNLVAIRKAAQILGIRGNNPKKTPGASLKDGLKKKAEYLLFLHFFGHSHDGGEPSLLIEEDKIKGTKVIMTQAEIQHLNLRNSNLILINACRGGAGKTANGEAPVSIFKAFLKAGARNIYYSLFRIDQKAAKDFTCKFLTELTEGKNFIDALSTAQRDFIRRGDEKSHPTMWASPSFIGNQMQELYSPAQNLKR